MLERRNEKATIKCGVFSDTRHTYKGGPDDDDTRNSMKAGVVYISHHPL